MSSGVNIQVEGVDKAIADLKATELRKRGRLVQAVALTAIMGEGEMKRMLSQPGTGKFYQLYKPRRTHRASSPSKPPATDLGTYRASWRHDIHSLGLGADILTNQERGPWLEYGTKNMAARPHVGPVSEKLKPIWIANAKRALSD